MIACNVVGHLVDLLIRGNKVQFAMLPGVRISSRLIGLGKLFTTGKEFMG